MNIIMKITDWIPKPGPTDIPIGLVLVGSMLIVITTYSLLAAAVCLMQPYNEIDVDAPFTIAFEAVGMNWAKLLVGIGALKGMTTVLLAIIIAESRYFTHIARTHMALPILAVVHKKLGTPVNAAVIMTATNCVVAFFTSLDVLASLLSISTLFIFSLVAIGLLVRRYYSTGVTSDKDRNKLIIFLVLIVCSATGMALLWAWGVNSWLVYLFVVGIWFSATLGIRLKVKQARRPKVWGAPFVPWLPSGSIALNLFMMGSIDGASFLRFMGWTAVLLTYYVLVGLHASYDASKETVKMQVEDNEVERGNNGERVSATSEPVELNTITTSRV
ncbi:putative cationic amino acid transporter [Helianthus annuus]|nr:putative cationic amino acid transporter [Helianthus annuus]